LAMFSKEHQCAVGPRCAPSWHPARSLLSCPPIRPIPGLEWTCFGLGACRPEQGHAWLSRPRVHPSQQDEFGYLPSADPWLADQFVSVRVGGESATTRSSSPMEEDPDDVWGGGMGMSSPDPLLPVSAGATPATVTGGQVARPVAHHADHSKEVAAVGAAGPAGSAATGGGQGGKGAGPEGHHGTASDGHDHDKHGDAGHHGHEVGGARHAPARGFCDCLHFVHPQWAPCSTRLLQWCHVGGRGGGLRGVWPPRAGCGAAHDPVCGVALSGD
jgi:hypothetical protein